MTPEIKKQTEEQIANSRAKGIVADRLVFLSGAVYEVTEDGRIGNLLPNEGIAEGMYYI